MYSLAIHDDGTLGDEAVLALRRHFPDARLISRRESDGAVLDGLASYPLCAELRRTNMLSVKLFDFRHYLESDRMLLLDSDILFFSEPQELLHRIEDAAYLKNSVNEDISSVYTVDPDTVTRTLGFGLQPRFNSGLGLIHKSSLNLDWIEQFLQLPGIIGHFWRIEQTLMALCSSSYGVQLLPPAYSVRLEGNSDGLPCRHYIGKIRHLMYREGMQRLVRGGFLERVDASANGRS
jgi:alpha-N-acetylglucosamine transferase